MSIEDQRLEAEKAFSRIFAGMSEEDFATNVERFAYLKELLRRFRDLAPSAWSDILEHRVAVHRQVEAFVSGQSEATGNDVFHASQELANEWCRAHRLESENGWFEKMAAVTLYGMSLHDLLGLELPNDFGMFRYIFHESEEGAIRSAAATANFDPFAVVEVDASPGPQTWDQFRETKAQFRERARSEFTARLDRQLNEFDTSPFSPKAVDINFQWVEWFITVQVDGQPISQVSRKSGVSRTAIRDGVRGVCDRLGIKYHGASAKTS